MTVRWDAVVDKSRFWAEPSLPSAVPATPRQGSGAPTTAKVWLFGELAGFLAERPLELILPEGSTAGDLVAELGRRCGAEFLERVLGADGRKFSHCRMFVDGRRVDDMATPVHCGPSPAVVEIILLAAIEGG